MNSQDSRNSYITPYSYIAVDPAGSALSSAVNWSQELVYRLGLVEDARQHTNHTFQELRNQLEKSSEDSRLARQEIDILKEKFFSSAEPLTPEPPPITEAERSKLKEEIENLQSRTFELCLQLSATQEEGQAVLCRARECVGDEVPNARDMGMDDCVSAMKQRIEGLESALKIEAAARRRAESALSLERDRHNAELEAVKRECKEPFVVPALLDAFLDLSRTTEQLRG
ncbi:hypothetical protein OF83DRAFT_1132070 [Amylostereum chailletii]|nr:hypothetical protein OF83DRAFT_1132070 [Amylostereum chailletii]